MPMPAQETLFVEPTSSASAGAASAAATTTSRIAAVVTHTQQQQQQQQQTYYDGTKNIHQPQAAAALQQHQKSQPQPHVVFDGTNFTPSQQQQFQRIIQQRRVSISTRTSSGNLINATATLSQNYVVRQQANNQQQQQQQHQLIRSSTVPANLSSAVATTVPQNATQQQQQQQQTTTQAQQQILQLSEDFMTDKNVNSNVGSSTANARNVMISTSTGNSGSGDVLNQQIYKIVTTDGTTGNMIIDSMAPTPNNSKVLLSNLTVLSKPSSSTTTTNNGNTITAGQQQQQQSNYLTSKPNFSYVTSSTATKQQPKFALTSSSGSTLTAYKANNLGKPLMAGTYLHQPSTQQTTTLSGGQQATQLVQKVNVTSRLASRISSYVPSTGNTLHQQPQTQILLQHTQPKYVAGRPSAHIIKKTTNPKVITTSTALAATTASITTNSNPNSNMGGNKSTINILHQQQQQLQTQNVKTFITQQQQQPVASYKAAVAAVAAAANNKSKFKQYNNIVSNNAVSIASFSTQPPTTQQQQQQQQQQQTLQNSYNSKVIGHQIQQPMTTAKVTKLSNNKYVLQHQQQQQPLQHIATLPQGTQLQHKGTLQTTSQALASGYVIQQATGTNAVTGGQNLTTSAIKFVNSHGTVIQQHQPVAATAQKIVARQQQHYMASPQQQLQIVETAIDGGANNVYQLATTTTPNAATQQQQQQQQQQHKASIIQPPQTTSMITDDVMNVNGTQMTEEVSARILQSMAQNSFSNQQQRFQAAQKPHASVSASNNNMPPPVQQQTHSQQPSSSPQHVVLQHGSNSTSSILLSPRDYTFYQQQQQQQLSSSPVHQFVPQSPTGGSGTYLTITSSASAANSSSTTPSVSISTHGFTGTTISPYISATVARRQSVSAPSSRSQSMERKMHEVARKSAEFFKHGNNTSSISSSSTTNNYVNPTSNLTVGGSSSSLTVSNLSSMRNNSVSSINLSSTAAASFIPLENSTVIQNMKATPTAAAAAAASSHVVNAMQINSTLAGVGAGAVAQADEELYIEEVRPVPVNTQDLRLQQLHAIMQDHTYASQQQQQQSSLQANTNGNAMSMQHWSLGGIGATVGSQLPQPGGYSAFYAQQMPRQQQQQDDDAHSAISTNSRLGLGDIDPGEETETAPEGEAEDDSITRCICDQTHDDGYMICCDKCSAWQHVDCMGIDRQNIPDEYLCDVCQPRIVDKSRARALQRQKRKEQQTQMLLNATQGAAAAQGALAAGGSAVGGVGLGPAMLSLSMPNPTRFSTSSFNTSGNDGTLQALNNTTGHNSVTTSGGALQTTKKGKAHKKTKEPGSGKKSKKGSGSADKSQNNNATNQSGASSKSSRKESKKNSKRKSKSTGDSHCVGLTVAEKHAANLRQWIVNYEFAVTNHYSPELRARLQSITKSPSLLQSISNTENKTLKSCGDIDKRALVVPFAGTKVLISSQDIPPNMPIVELRGKYMLTTQFRTQNDKIYMNSPPPNNYMNCFKTHKTPGQFLFFYQLPGVEAQNQTLNADGSCPQEQPQPPPYLKQHDVCVDTRTYGNDARFVRRSCRPNAEIQHYFEKGTLHLYIVSLTNIRAQTEITIKHEPHDLAAVESKKSNNAVVQPTSSKCACDMGNNCLFALPTSIQQQLATVGQPKSSRNKSTSLSLSSAGAMQLTMGGLSNSLLPAAAGTATTSAAAAAASTAQQRQRQAAAAANTRNRSTSSSGDSNTGLNSPNITQMNLGLKASNGITTLNGCNSNNNNTNNNNSIIQATTATNNVIFSSNLSNTSSSVSSVMLDSGICTSSSSPSVSIPSPTPHIHSPTQNAHQSQQQQQQTMVSLTSTVSSGNGSGMLQRATILQVPQSPTQMQQQSSHQQHVTPMMSSTSLLLSPHLTVNASQQQPQTQQKQQSLLQSPQKHQQPLAVIAAAAATQSPMVTSNTAAKEQIFYVQPQQQYILSPQLQNQQQQQQQLTIAASQEAQMAANALQSLHASSSSTSSSTPATTSSSEQQTPAPTQLNVLEPTPITATSSNTSAAATVSVLVPTPTKSPQKATANQSVASNNASTSASAQPTTSRKTPAKHSRSSNSHSEDVDNADDGAPIASTPKEKPKLTREDRKMQAILRAIEKMEKEDSKGRKKETKQAKRQNSSSYNNSPASPAKRQNSCSDQHDVTPTSTTAQTSRKNAITSRKKKRKASRSLSGGASGAAQRKRRKSSMVNNESDGECNMPTSESDGISMLSPPIETATTISRVNCMPTSDDISVTYGTTTNADQAAGLLLALAQTKPTDFEAVSSEASPPPTPPMTAQLSSACQLIEAAMGPLVQLDSGLVCDKQQQLQQQQQQNATTQQQTGEFKYPINTKTKKMLMSNWLNQTDSNASAVVASPTSPLDSLVQAAMCEIKVSEQQKQLQQQQRQRALEQPQNLSIVALKVEEFIHQTETGSPGTGGSIAAPESYATMAYPSVGSDANTATRSNLQLPLQVLTAANNSSVKKRWLRQAISEETDENASIASAIANTPHSASPNGSGGVLAVAGLGNGAQTLSNGFTTPLKKRRLLMNNNGDKQDDGIDEIASTASSPHATDQLLEDERQKKVDITKLNVQQEDALVDVVGGDNKCELKQEPDVDVGSRQDDRKVKMNDAGILKSTSPSNIIDALAPLKVETNNQDQDDDVDILRSPSPGGQIVAEDNLVKIEPEDTSGAADDVKIDVEREESQACDKFEEMFKVKREQVVNAQVDTQTAARIDVKREQKPTTGEEIAKVEKQEATTSLSTTISASTTSPKAEVKHAHVKHEKASGSATPSSSSVKLEKHSKLEKAMTAKVEKLTTSMNAVKHEAAMSATRKPNSIKQEIVVSQAAAEPKPGESLLRNAKANIKQEQAEKKSRTENKHETEEPTKKKPKLDNAANNLSSSSSSLAAASAAAAAAKLERKNNERKNLTEHDIQERLHSFHAENISYLQSRNKKTKNSSSSGSETVSNSHSSTISKAIKMKKEHKDSESSSSSASSKKHKHSNSSSSSSNGANNLIATTTTSTSKKAHKKQRTKSASEKLSDKSEKLISSNDAKVSSSKNKTTSASKSSSSASSSTSSSSMSILSAPALTNGKANSGPVKAQENNTLRRRTMSMCVTGPNHNNNMINVAQLNVVSSSKATAAAAAAGQQLPLLPPGGGKKRQTNFEQELTKSNPPVPLNSNAASSSNNNGSSSSSNNKHHQHHRKENRIEENVAASSAIMAKLAKITRRRESMCGSVYQAQAIAAAIKKEKREKRKSKKADKPEKSIGKAEKAAAAAVAIKAPLSNNSAATNSVNENHLHVPPTPNPTKVVLTTATTPTQVLHPTIPHFNNIVTPTASTLSTPTLIAHHHQTTTTTIPPLAAAKMQQQSQQTNFNLQPQTLPLPTHVVPPVMPVAQPIPQPIIKAAKLENTDAAPIPVVITQPVHSSVNLSQVATKPLPYYNTIYGKLTTDNHVVTKLPAAPSLSEFLDSSKSRTFATLTSSAGGVAGSYNPVLLTSVNKRPNANNLELANSNAITPTVPVAVAAAAATAAANINSGSTPMAISAVPLSAAVSASCGAATAPISNSSSNPPEMPPPNTPIKIYTRTASHDPRLNPMLSAPEPAPMPKRKLSISEYRMRQRPSFDANSSGSNTPTSSYDSPDSYFQRPSASSLSSSGNNSPLSSTSPIAPPPTINKCSLQSPERFHANTLQRRNSISVHNKNNNNNKIYNVGSEKIGGPKSSSTTAASTLSTVNNILSTAHRLNMFEEKPKGGQFNAAPTQLEQQQEKISERSRCLHRTISCDSRVVNAAERAKRDEEDHQSYRNRNHKNNDLDNSLEAISSTSTSVASSRESSPEMRTMTTPPTTKMNAMSKKKTVDKLQQQQQQQKQSKTKYSEK